MPAKPVLYITALLATIYAAVSFIFGYETDFTVSALTATLCLGAVFWLDTRTHELENKLSSQAFWLLREQQEPGGYRFEHRRCGCGDHFEVLTTAPYWMQCPTCTWAEIDDDYTEHLREID